MAASNRSGSIAARYGGALACAAAAVAARALLAPNLENVPYFGVFLAVLASVRYFGAGPALFAAAGGAFGSILLFPTNWSRLLLFLLSAALVIGVVETLRRARRDAEKNAALAQERLAQIEKETQLRAAEERLSSQLRAIVESSEDAIISKDLQGIIQSWNGGAEQIFGYAAAEVVGKSIKILLPADRSHEESNIMEQIRRGGKVRHFETVRVRKDGKQIDVSITVSPMRDPQGTIIGASHITRDITEQKQFEEQLRQTQKLESLGVLAGGLAHDFNNLLTGIMGNASLATGEFGTPERAQARIEEILSASERAALLIRQMLAYAGKGRFLVERLDLSAQIREIVPLLRTSVPKLVEIDMQLAGDLPPIEADRSQIQQLIMNLAINGAEAIGDRPGTLTITTSSPPRDSAREVVLEVRDTGAGMTEETKSRIFDPFFTTKFTGRGLGLSAVLGIIRAHRGSISVESEPGRGTTFTVTLPAAAGTAPTTAPADDTDLRGEGLILVADDEELIRNMARFTLERYGYTVDAVEDGRQAVDRFAEHPADYAGVLLDLTMPAMNGEEVLRAIRAIRHDIPVLLSSGFTESEALKRFEDLRLDGFLQKPYTATILARKMAQAVHRRRVAGS